jgi:hypothetical protein
MDVATALILGALTIAGGPARVTGPGFAVLNHNGGPYLWGAVLVALGVCEVAAAAGPPRLLLAVLVLAATLYGLFGLWFFLSALPGGSSFWAPVLCARATGMHLSRAWAYREGHTE